MFRFWLPAAFLSASLASAAAGAPARAADTLRLLTWGGYAPENVVQRFEEETGIEVEVTFSNNEEMIARLRAADGGGFDLAQPSHDRVHAAQIEFGVYKPMDLSRIDASVYDPGLLEAVKANTTIDGEVYSVPHFWGTSGLVVNRAEAPDLGSFADLCDPRYEGRVSMRLKRTLLIGMAMAMGEDPFGAYGDAAEYGRIIDAAAGKIIACKANVRAWWTDADDLSNLLRAGEIVASDAWDGIAFKLNAENPDIVFRPPSHGAMGWIDTFTLPRGTRAEDAAYRWIGFVMRPDVAKLMSGHSGYLTAREDGGDLAPGPIRESFRDAFSPEDVADIQWFASVPPGLEALEGRVLDRIEAAGKAPAAGAAAPVSRGAG